MPALRKQLEHLPDPGHYEDRYTSPARVHSHAHQIASIVESGARSLLEVGVGTGFVPAALRTLGIRVTTLDLEVRHRPDLVGTVTEIPADDDAFEASSCCQVLEHLEIPDVIAALRELRRVTTGRLIVSLPDHTRSAWISIRVPRVVDRSFCVRIPRLRARAMPPERLDRMGHHWELGYEGYPLGRFVQAAAGAGWRLQRTWRVPQLVWHRFFVFA